MEKQLQPIAFNHIPNILLIGNGINRSFGGSSWDSIMGLISTGEFDSDQDLYHIIDSLPYALQTIVVSSDSVSEGMKEIASNLMPKPISAEHSKVLSELIGLHKFDAILTPNYSYEIETALDPCFALTAGTASKYRHSSYKGSKPQEQFGLFKYNYVAENYIWHIHGEAAKPSSMVMGHYYYGKLLAEIEKRIPYTIREYFGCSRYKRAYMPKSWIDLFLISNIHIIGFGLDPSEIDIWWLLNCKKRNFTNCGNIFYYEPNVECKDKYALKALLKTFGISYYSCITSKDYTYKDFYYDVIAKLKDNI